MPPTYAVGGEPAFQAGVGRAERGTANSEALRSGSLPDLICSC
jgi:hypothetical protein